MNLPNLDVVFPQLEPIQFSECTFCNTEINIGDEVVDHAGYLFCDRMCMATELLKNGLAVSVVAGE